MNQDEDPVRNQPATDRGKEKVTGTFEATGHRDNSLARDLEGISVSLVQ